MNDAELDKYYLTMNFKSGEDAIKISLFNFIELVMMGTEKRQHMD